MSRRDRHRRELNALLYRYRVEPDLRDKFVEEILRVNDRFESSNPSLDEALNSGDGSYKP